TRTLRLQSNADAAEQSAITAETAHFVELIRSTGNFDVLEKEVRRSYGWSSDTRRWLTEMLLWQKGLPQGPIGSDPIAQAVDRAVSQMPEPWRRHYRSCRLAESFLTEVLRLPANKAGPQDWIRANQRVSEAMGFPRMSRAFGLF